MKKKALLLFLSLLVSSRDVNANSCKNLLKLVINSVSIDGSHLSQDDLKAKVFDIARKVPLVVSNELGKTIYYPTIVPYRAIKHFISSRKQGKNLRTTAVDFIRKDGVAISFVITSYALAGHGPINFFIEINNASEYFEQLDDNERSDGITIYVDGIPKDNALYGSGEVDFQRRFGDQKNAYYLEPSSLADMFQKINELSRSKKIARLEFIGHGKPGTIDLKGEDLNKHNAYMFKEIRDKFIPKAEIRFLSCDLTANPFPERTGEDFMNEVGQNAFSDGGTVFGSNRLIMVDFSFGDEKSRELKAIQKIIQFWATPVSMSYQIPLELQKIIGDNSQPFRKIEFPPTGQ